MGKRLTRTGELADLRQEKRLGRFLGHRAWFMDMGFKGLPKDVRITPMKIRQATLDGAQGTVVASAKMEFTERIGPRDHPVELIHTDCTAKAGGVSGSRGLFDYPALRQNNTTARINFAFEGAYNCCDLSIPQRIVSMFE